MPLARFHPAVRSAFATRYGEPTEVQRAAFERLPEGGHGLFAAPTGSGKTLAAFLSSLDRLATRAAAGILEDALSVVYVSPLRALSHDIAANLEAPLAAIAERLPPSAPAIRVAVRTGDTPAHERRLSAKRPPHVLVTTPESLYVLLTSESGRSVLRTAETVIVDEIHALVGSRRGDHLALSLARLDRVAGRPLQRVGLSATQRPIERVARFLAGDAPCDVVDIGMRRDLDVALELPGSPLEPALAGEIWDEIHDRIAALAREHRTTLVFVGNRRGCERTGLALASRIGEERVATHHGSLSRSVRLSAESRLRSGSLAVLVATSSLELGIDVGDVDLVVQLGSPGSISGFLQRVGRARHQVGGTPKGRLFPLSPDDLIECIALLEARRLGELEELPPREGSLDVLAQQLVATVAEGPIALDDLFALVRSAEPFGSLARSRFDAVVTMLGEGFATARGRRGALLHVDAVNGLVRPRRAARLTALTNGGTIPDTFDYDVLLEPQGLRVGSLHEDFAIESTAGDVFQLGSTSYRIARVLGQTVRVVDAHGVPPSLPFWVAEGRTRSDALTAAVARLHGRIDAALARGEDVRATLEAEPGVGPVAAAQAADHLSAARAALTRLPTDRTVVIERFFDEAGSAHLVIHVTLGARRLRAFALALRKRMCRAFDVELQAAALEDAFLISLGPQHAFGLDEVFGFVRMETARDLATQAVLDRPVFETRFRWNATRALAVPRTRGGKRMPAPIQRVRANDLLAVCFPDQVACLENVQGPRTIPDHPLVASTLRDCLEEWMDVAGLEGFLSAHARGEVEVVVRELTEPSPLARGVLGAKPYAYLDDAPLEERRARAVSMRRFLRAEDAAALGALDPAVIERVRREADPPARDADELHDALLSYGVLAAPTLDPALLDALVSAGRAQRTTLGARPVVFATERKAEIEAALPHAGRGAVLPFASVDFDALTNLFRRLVQREGPVRSATLADLLALDGSAAEAALVRLVGEGLVLRGRFTPGVTEDEFCERGLLARIHRGTLDGLRAAIEPVEPATYLDRLFDHHGVTEPTRRRGESGLLAALGPLEGFEAPASSFDDALLPLRVADYHPAMLDSLGLDGRIAWIRRTGSGAGASVRRMPVALAPPERVEGFGLAPDTSSLGSRAAAVLALLEQRGPRFPRELASGLRLLPEELDAALRELVASGAVRSDAFAGLRALYGGARDRRAEGSSSASYRTGRFLVVDRGTRSLEAEVDRLLARYLVVFRRVVERDPGSPPFRELLPILRAREARGELRGGRFVAGVSGEQYASDATVSALRAARNRGPSSGLVVVSALDPLNLAGYVDHGPRVPQLARHRVLFEDGSPRAALMPEARTLVPSRPLGERERTALAARLRSSPGRPLDAAPRAVEPVG